LAVEEEEAAAAAVGGGGGSRIVSKESSGWRKIESREKERECVCV